MSALDNVHLIELSALDYVRLIELSALDYVRLREISLLLYLTFKSFPFFYHLVNNPEGLIREVFTDIQHISSGDIRSLYHSNKYPNKPDKVNLF